jgi:hypothetical protein
MLDVETRIPLARVRRAGPTSPPHIARARVAAEAIGILLTGKGDAARVLPADDQNAAVLAHSLLDRCAEAQTQWTNAVHQVIGLASPVLERSDVNIAFERIRASRCWQSLGEVARSRLELLEAINNRDGEGMRRYGEALLERPEAGLDTARHIWLMAALTGHIVTGHLPEARALWEKHAPNLSAAARSALPFRVLAARLRS